MPESLPHIKDALGAEVYDHIAKQKLPVRTSSMDAPAWRAGNNTTSTHAAGDPRLAYIATYKQAYANLNAQFNPHVYGSGPYSRHPSVSSASLASAAGSTAESVPSSPATTSCSSDTFGATAHRRRTANRRSRSDRRSPNPNKNRKEKKHRYDLGSLIRVMENDQANYIGKVEGSGQMAGNKKSSGLSITKLDVLKGEIAIARHLMDKEYKRAKLNGTLPQLQDEWLRVQREHRDPANPDHDPAYGTLMRRTDVGCSRGDNEVCAKHGRPDWAVCQQTLVAQIFRSNEDAFMREYALKSKKARTE